MDVTKQIKALPFMDSASKELHASLTELGSIKSLEAGQILAKQFEVGQYLYFQIGRAHV